MARRAFFSFHYERDIFRVNQVRNSWRIKPGDQEAIWYDASLWEEAKLKGEQALCNLINDGLNHTSVTVVLIGAETAQRKWVNYEIIQSHERGNGLLGIYIHNIKNQYGVPDKRGVNPLSIIPFVRLFQYPAYNWVSDEGYKNIGKWIEEAARKAGR